MLRRGFLAVILFLVPTITAYAAALSPCDLEFIPPPRTVFKGTVGTSFVQTIQVKNKTGGPLSFVEFNISSLPAGLRQESGEAITIVKIVGTPLQAGTFNITVSASASAQGSSGCQSSATFFIEIEEGSCPEITFEPAGDTITLTNGGSIEIVPLYNGQPKAGGVLELSVSPASDFDIKTESGSQPGSVKVTLSLKGNPSQPTLTAKLTDGLCTGSKIYNLNILPGGGGLELTSQLDFGSVNLNTEATRILEAINTSNSSISINSVDFMGPAGPFRLDGTLTGNLAAQSVARMNVIFKPTVLGAAVATLLIQTSLENRTVELRGNSIDTTLPSVSITSPQGGQIFTSGSTMNIAFQATDNDRVTGYTITASIGGQTFNIASLDANATSVIWSIPELLRSASGAVTVTAIDPSGNRGSATSGTFQIQQSQSSAPLLTVFLTFDPPPAGQIAPPQNLRVTATEFRAFKPSPVAPQQSDAILTGYNIYRILQPDPGQPLPSPEDIIKNGILIGSAEATATSFTDTVSTSKGDNFAYTVTSTFGSGQQSQGANPAATDLPVIKNPRYAKGSLLIDLAKSYIKQGASISVDDTETYLLQVDASGIQYAVPKSQKSTPGGKTIKKVIPKDKAVLLKVKNPDGKVSVAVQFKR